MRPSGRALTAVLQFTRLGSFPVMCRLGRARGPDVALGFVWLLLPAAATVTALVVLAVGLRTVARAAEALQAALRRSAATSVASDELLRAVSTVADHAAATRASSDRLRGRPRPGSRSRHRR